jgi:hypothetical protein
LIDANFAKKSIFFQKIIFHRNYVIKFAIAYLAKFGNLIKI